MAKILVVTYTNSLDNYGQVLQYYATQEYLKSRGHDVSVHFDKSSFLTLCKRKIKQLKDILAVLIKGDNSKTVGIDKRSHVSEDDEKQQLLYKWQESIERTEKLHPRKFSVFKKKNFNIKYCPFSKLSKLHLDACVVGSDQTWSGIWGYYFLNWAPAGAKRIALAPSVGHKVYSKNEIAEAHVLLEKFDLITVREDNGVDFCKEAGRNDAIKILDPTFLLTSSEYLKIEKNHKQQSPFILLYLLGGEIEVKVEEIYSFAKRENLDVVYVASQGREDDYPKYYAEVGEWLSLIRDAKYVFTNSFHGMALSLIYHKNFLVFPLVGIMKGMNGRINDLSSILSLNNIYKNSLDAVKNSINYGFVDSIINKNRGVLSDELQKLNL